MQTGVDAEPVFRAAYRLGQVAEDVSTAAARTARCYPDDWRGDAGIAYQRRLDATAERVRRMSVAYGSAGAALLSYANALLEGADIRLRAEALLAEAEACEERATAASAVSGVAASSGPAAELRSAAYRLQADAEAVVGTAATRCAAALDDEAGRAPATGWWRSTDRAIGDVAVTALGVAAGGAALLRDGWRSLPGVGSRHGRHESRRELVDSAVAAVSIWDIPIEIGHAMRDDRPGLAAGELFSAVGPGRLAKLDRLRIHDVRLAHLEALREADLLAERAGHVVHARTAAEMGTIGVDLRNEEARGGHVRLRHVAAEDEYLFARNDAGTRLAGTFPDLPTAQRLVNQVLRRNAGRLDQVYTSGKPLRLVETFNRSTGAVAIAGSSRTVTAYKVRVVLKLAGGEPFVYTAFPEL